MLQKSYLIIKMSNVRKGSHKVKKKEIPEHKNRAWNWHFGFVCWIYLLLVGNVFESKHKNQRHIHKRERKKPSRLLIDRNHDSLAKGAFFLILKAIFMSAKTLGSLNSLWMNASSFFLSLQPMKIIRILPDRFGALSNCCIFVTTIIWFLRTKFCTVLNLLKWLISNESRMNVCLNKCFSFESSILK